MTEHSENTEPSNSTKPVLATADQLVKELEFALETCWFTKKNDYSSGINVNDIRPKLQKLIEEYKSLKGGCC